MSQLFEWVDIRGEPYFYSSDILGKSESSLAFFGIFMGLEFSPCCLKQAIFQVSFEDKRVLHPVMTRRKSNECVSGCQLSPGSSSSLAQACLWSRMFHQWRFCLWLFLPPNVIKRQVSKERTDAKLFCRCQILNSYKGQLASSVHTEMGCFSWPVRLVSLLDFAYQETRSRVLGAQMQSWQMILPESVRSIKTVCQLLKISRIEAL